MRPVGPACHTGNYTCFYRAFSLPGSDSIRDDVDSDSAGRGFTDLLGVKVVEQSSVKVRMDLPITADVLQPVGFLHGGATITLLESCCSLASWLGCDLENEYSYGEATLERSEDLGEKGRKEFWHVEATAEDGRLVSTGTITCRVVTREYFASK